MAEKPNFGEQVKEANKDNTLTKDELTSMLTDDQVAELRRKGSEARNAFLKLSEAERKEFQKELGMKGNEVDGLFGPDTLDHMFLAAGMPEKVVLEKNKILGKKDTKVESSQESEMFPSYNPNLSPEKQREHAKMVAQLIIDTMDYLKSHPDVDQPKEGNERIANPNAFRREIQEYIMFKWLFKMLPPDVTLWAYLKAQNIKLDNRVPEGYLSIKKYDDYHDFRAKNRLP